MSVAIHYRQIAFRDDAAPPVLCGSASSPQDTIVSGDVTCKKCLKELDNWRMTGHLRGKK